MTQITDRIERELGVPGLAALLADRIEPSDLTSLLLEVHRRRVERKRAPDVLAEYEQNRFVSPAGTSPARFVEWDRLALALLPAAFDALELSPVCPIGTCAAVAAVSQDWAVSTARNTEVVSDVTNVLALEAALRRRALLRSAPRSAQPVHLAASHRVVRPQLAEAKGLLPHFRLLSLCSAGRDTGSLRFETDALALHVGFHLTALRAHLGPSVGLRVALTAWSPGSPLDAAAERVCASLRERFEGVACALDPDRASGRGYYPDLCFKLYATPPGGAELELGDGGVVDWTQKLLANAKERLLVSGVGSDRVCALAPAGGVLE